MAIVAASLAVAVCIGTYEQDIQWERLGEITAYGQTDPDSRTKPAVKVPITFPVNALPAVSDDQPYVEFDGWKYEINQWGNIGRAWKGKGGFDELKQLYDASQKRIAEGKSNKWKIKCVIFRRTNVLYRNSLGALESQRAFLIGPEEQFCLETFGRFGAMVEAYTQGAIDVEFTFSMEDEPVTGYYQGNDVWTLDPRDAGVNYLRGRFNRGDYDSVLYMFHPGRTRSFSFGGTAGRINNATASYVILSNGREMGPRIGHTEAMIHEWLHQVEYTWNVWGYGSHPNGRLPDLHGAEANGFETDSLGNTGWFSWIREFMVRNVSQEMWSKLTNRTDPDWQEAFSRTIPYSGKTIAWSDARQDPWGRLPYLTAADLAQISGAPKFRVLSEESRLLFDSTGEAKFTGSSAEDYRLNGLLNFSREAMARLTVGDRELLFVRWDAADLILSNLSQAAVVRGYFSLDSKAVIVAEQPNTGNGLTELNKLRLGNGAVKSVVEGKGEYSTGEKPLAKFSSTGSDVRYTAAQWDGTAVQLGDNGELPASALHLGANVLRLTAVSADGSRSERPFVIRVAQIVESSLTPVGSSYFAGDNFKVRLRVNNTGAARKVLISPSLPTGWTVAGIPNEVPLKPGEGVDFEGTVSVPSGAAEGEAAIAFDIRDSENQGLAVTSRMPVHKTQRIAFLQESFESSFGNWTTPRDDSAGWKATIEPGGHTGSGLKISDAGGARFGRVHLFGDRMLNGKRKPNGMAYSAQEFPWLDFYFKTGSRECIGISVTTTTGKRYVIMLTGPFVEQWGQAKELTRAKFVPNGEWQRVVYNLKDALAKRGDEVYVSDIAIGDSRTFSSNQFQDGDVREYFLDDFNISKTGDPTQNSIQDDADAEISSIANAKSSNADERALAAATYGSGNSSTNIQELRELVVDKNSKVRLNAAQAFITLKDAAAAKLIADNLKSEPDETVMMMMVRALAFQDTPEGWKAIAEVPKLGRSDEQGMQEAARQLALKRAEASVRDVTTTITARSWITRAEGAKALGSFPFESAKLDLMTFLFEVDPHVRIEVGRQADVNNDLVRRRMEWGSINDLSDVVRGYCYAALTRASDPVIRSRGYSGLREANPDVRAIIAEEIGRDPQNYHVAMLLDLIKDPNPDVRASALVSFLKMPGEKTWAQLASLETESYEQVLIPLLQWIRSGKVNTPAGFLQRLTVHRSPDVSKIAMEILGS